MKSLIITGTGTDVGKTLLSSMIVATHPEYYYWKPVQSGMFGETDSQLVQSLSGCDTSRIVPERYTLRQPLSPHRSAKLDSVTIEQEQLALPQERPLLIEGAGGVMVPMSDALLSVDLFTSWQLPVLIACRSELGTINHTLLTCEALRSREIPILGAVCIGELNIENERAIEQFGKLPVLGRIVLDKNHNRETLLDTYREECGKLKEALLS